ncbi:Leucine-rich repeat and coiled-coil domain-containing protein 1 [Tetrabaena socialis]|uniref:Leucine-rich repeat and coiled-coil domain-containing protein 1 n=1 Tax=Tetrabaena socialis TaxID=47790 RepID=A0A2J8A4T9_9CHLO|nr:Leucine-rich repeat and coiled-coil domain-containing protein 1 [Tetrabaena socialis]|eukprot:PNH07526.1 Leucine-rich repeat and coiled-coil domain-containing protein 1 [Tetrabaena socialis]
MSAPGAAEAAEVEDSLSCIGQGLLSVAQVPNIHRLTGLRSLCLHGNNIAQLEGLQALTSLVDLNLSSNAVASIDPGSLRGLTLLTSLNLAGNRLQAVQGLDGLSSLEHLNLSYNYITSLGGLSALQGPRCQLRQLNLKHNQLHQLQGFSVLVGCISLRWLQVEGNPVCQLPNCLQALASVLPHVARLDSMSSAEALAAPYDVQAAQQYASIQLQSFEPLPPAPSPMAAAAAAPPPPPAALQQRPQQQPPRAAAPQAQMQHWKGGPGQAGAPRASEEGFASGTADVLPASDQRQVPLSQQQQQPARVAKIISAEAAAQTSEYTPLVRRVQAEAAEVRQQLGKMTDELERRNAAEEALRLAMQEAIAAAQEGAHRKVEDGYREASFAVSKALWVAGQEAARGRQELETARHAATEAQQRATSCSRSEEEQRARCTTLEKDVTRLRDEVQRLQQLLLDQQHAAAAALGDERRRGAAGEGSLREQLAAAQAAAAELQMVRAAAATAEAKVASLEAALQQSSTVTVSMTAKIAQTMAEANAQIDILKARLTAADQAIAEHQRREADARAEINTLTAALMAAHAQHDRELDAAGKQHEESLRAAVEKERVAAEERGKTVAALQAQQERAGLQEQVAFLKVQLQFALKESDKEQQGAQQALRVAHAEAADLRAALQAAAGKQREGEALVSDLAAVVQQQKAAIQGLQRDREALAARLRVCSPDAVDVLAAENVALKRAAAERDMYREQADDVRRRWQEAERRVSSSRSSEELAARARGLEAALAAAREEGARVEAAGEKLRQELAAQQDAVKIKVAMLDSANDTIASLKAEIADVQVEADEARRAAEEAEAALSREQHDDDGEQERLRAELQAAEAAAAASRAALAEAAARSKELEGRVRVAQEAVAEKDRMIKYVEEEVDRVKGLLENREQRLRDQRDAARGDAEAALAGRDAAAARLADALARGERLAREVEHARGQLEDAAVQLEAQRRAAAEAGGEAAAAGAEAARLGARVAEVEEEMRGLLVAVERQKASAAHKMKQLASLLQEL